MAASWTADRLCVAVGAAFSVLSFIFMIAFIDTYAIVAFFTAPLPGVFAGSVLYLCTRWVRSQRCVTYVNRAINMMIPGKQGTYRECLADRPLSIRAIRCMNHASTAEFDGAGVMGPLAAIAYSEFIVGPCWVMAYEASLAATTAPGLSRASRACIAALAHSNVGSDVMAAWYTARYRHLSDIAASSADTVRDSFDLLPALETRLREKSAAPLSAVLRPLAASVDAVRRAHLVANAICSTFYARIARCFCDWPWPSWTPLGRLHRLVMTQMTARDSLRVSNFEGVSFSAMAPTDAAFRTADRDDELRVEELPVTIVAALAPLPAVHRAIAAWHRSMIRSSRQPFRVESRDAFHAFTQSVGTADWDDLAATSLPRLGQAADATPHPSDRSCLFFALMVAMRPKDLTHAHLMAALHEKSALGALHAACFGATHAAIQIARQLCDAA